MCKSQIVLRQRWAKFSKPFVQYSASSLGNRSRMISVTHQGRVLEGDDDSGQEGSPKTSIRQHSCIILRPQGNNVAAQNGVVRFFPSGTRCQKILFLATWNAVSVWSKGRNAYKPYRFNLNKVAMWTGPHFLGEDTLDTEWNHQCSHHSFKS